MKTADAIRTSGASFFARLKQLSLQLKIVLFIVLLGIAWLGRTLLVGSANQIPQYQTAQAEKGTLVSSVTGTGAISSASSASITSSATGVVNEVFVQNGDTVSQDDTIATLNLDQSSTQKQAAAWANYLSAQNSLNAAKSKMNSLQAALFTASETFTKGAGTDNPDKNDPNYIIQNANWLQAEANYTQQGDVIKQSEAALSNAWLSYVQTSATITAPISGTIANLSLKPGGLIASNNSSSSNSDSSSSNASSSNSYGSVVLEGGSTEAVVNLSEVDITKVADGQKVTITMDAFPDKTFTGHVSSINTTGATSSGVTSYPVTISFDSSLPTMYPNMAVSATIITSIKNNALLVPSAAVQTSNGTSTVRVLKNNQVIPTEVTIGESNDTQTEILSGLQEGDAVVISQRSTSGSTSSGSQGQSTSPFGNTGFGGGRGFGGGGNQVFIRKQ
jgi:multidrug efflux pump subunit AcrA (membrane-fusion protein)